MAVDLDEQLKGHLTVLAQQVIADNERLAKHTLVAFQKDLYQGSQGEIGNILAALNADDIRGFHRGQ